MKIPATMIEGVANSAMTEDGHHMALTLREPSGVFLRSAFRARRFRALSIERPAR